MDLVYRVLDFLIVKETQKNKVVVGSEENGMLMVALCVRKKVILGVELKLPVIVAFLCRSRL